MTTQMPNLEQILENLKKLYKIEIEKKSETLYIIQGGKC
jgi:hypothetical protein